MNLSEISKTVSHALRHEPWLYEFELDSEGWVPVDELIAALRRHRDDWKSLNRSDLTEMIEKSQKQRHEIVNGRIRAFYGHSISGLLKKEVLEPPSLLYHGTNPEIITPIMSEGLKPMGRQYVHLSSDVETAIEVGRRKSRNPVILTVEACKAHDQGIRFYLGNEKVWLADDVPPAFLIYDLEKSQMR